MTSTENIFQEAEAVAAAAAALGQGVEVAAAALLDKDPLAPRRPAAAEEEVAAVALCLLGALAPGPGLVQAAAGELLA